MGNPENYKYKKDIPENISVPYEELEEGKDQIV